MKKKKKKQKAYWIQSWAPLSQSSPGISPAPSWSRSWREPVASSPETQSREAAGTLWSKPDPQEQHSSAFRSTLFTPDRARTQVLNQRLQFWDTTTEPKPRGAGTKIPLGFGSEGWPRCFLHVSLKKLEIWIWKFKAVTTTKFRVSNSAVTSTTKY